MSKLPFSLDSVSASHAWAAGAVVAGLATWYIASSTNSAKARRAGAVLAPGPKRALLVGNLFNFPKGRWYETFTQWAEEYGDIIYVDLGGLPMVILNSLDAINDLAEKKMNIHSNRPHTNMVFDIMGFSYWLPFMQPNKDFAEQRRLFQRAIGPRAVQEYDFVLSQGCSELLRQFDGFSGEPLGLITKTVGDVLTRISYGEHFFMHHGQECIQKNVEGLQLLSWVAVSFWFVDVVGALRYVPAWLPGAKFKRVGNQGKQYADNMRYWAFDKVKAAMAEGITDDSIVSKYLHEGSISEDNLRDAVSAIYGGGVDTTTSTLTHFLFSVTLYPSWQVRIQEEMDQVLGRGHLPTFDDLPKLSILNAVFKESLRWIPVAPLGLAHMSSSEDVWNGFYIPKGSFIHCNIGYVLRDPQIWGKDSQEFNPNRFLPEHNPSMYDLPDIWSVPFGFGRRVCPGKHLGQRTVLLYAAAILSSYELLPFEGEHLTPNEPFEDAVIRRVAHFRCTFRPRA